MKPMNVGMLGMGVVAGGTWDVLVRNAGEIARRAGRRIEITHIAVRSPEKARARVGEASVDIMTDLSALVRHPDIDIVVELIGGIEPARELVLQAIAHGKHVVTANKALLAKHGNEIFAAASERGVMVAFEAAVAGGIPIVKAIREGLTANRIQSLAGIINGTTNFILSEMRARSLSFEQALAQAQALGYAEADPTFDVQGIDAAHKLSLLASLAFGIPIQFDKAYVEGITALDSQDIRYAGELGYRVKLLGIAKRRAEGIELRVHPALVPQDRLLANVEGAMNAVFVQGDAVGPTLYYGQGAGGEPTASAVVADLVDVTRLHTADPGNRVPHLAFQPDALSDLSILPIERVRCSFYLRLLVEDQPGVLADIAKVLAAHRISIGSMIQKPAQGGSGAQLIFLTHEAEQGEVDQAIGSVEAMPAVLSAVTCLRVENAL